MEPRCRHETAIRFSAHPVVFVAYKLTDIYVATGVLIGVTLAQVGWIWLRQRQVEKLPLFTAGLVLVLGSLTLILHDPVFVKWKPTVVNWLFAWPLSVAVSSAGKPCWNACWAVKWNFRPESGST